MAIAMKGSMPFIAMKVSAVARTTMSDRYRLVSTPGLQFVYQVVRPDGLPDLPLTVFANDLSRSMARASVPVYLRELLLLVNWIATDPIPRTQGWELLGPPADVRNLIRQYVTVEASCKLTLRADNLGLKAAYITATDATRINVRTLLVVLKRFYETLIEQGLYPHANPVLHQEAKIVKTELKAQYRHQTRLLEQRDPMPAISGVDEPPSDIRLSESYFRLVADKWVPKSIDDPTFPRTVYEAGRRYGWQLREELIARMLFESGARISEILALTGADWSYSDFLNRFRACNKGSHGRRTKTLVISQATAKMLRRYFDDGERGRRAHDPLHLSLRDLTARRAQSPDFLTTVSLFLTGRGTPMTAKLFREHYWKPALRAAGIDADPHLARHWFVTNALRAIERESKNEAEISRRKADLIEYMGWKSGEATLRAYEHVRRGERFVATLSSIHRQMRRRETEVSRRRDPLPMLEHDADEASAADVDRDLTFVLGDDDDS